MLLLNCDLLRRKVRLTIQGLNRAPQELCTQVSWRETDDMSLIGDSDLCTRGETTESAELSGKKVKSSGNGLRAGLEEIELTII